MKTGNRFTDRELITAIRKNKDKVVVLKWTELSKILGVSETAVRNRIINREKQGMKVLFDVSTNLEWSKKIHYYKKLRQEPTEAVRKREKIKW